MAFDTQSSPLDHRTGRWMLVAVSVVAAVAAVGALVLRAEADDQAAADARAQGERDELATARVRIEIGRVATSSVLDDLGSVVSDAPPRPAAVDLELLESNADQLRQLIERGRLEEVPAALARDTVVAVEEAVEFGGGIWEMDYLSYVATMPSTFSASVSPAEDHLFEASMLTNIAYVVLETLATAVPPPDASPEVVDYLSMMSGPSLESDESFIVEGDMAVGEAFGGETVNGARIEEEAVGVSTGDWFAGGLADDEIDRLLTSASPTAAFVADAQATHARLTQQLLDSLDDEVRAATFDSNASLLEAGWMASAGVSIAALLLAGLLIMGRTRRLSASILLDPMTGVGNRRRLEELQHRWATGNGPAFGSAVVIDLDRFKMINDSYGHRAGDIVLQTIAAKLQRVVDDLCSGPEKGDVIRLGGDEFAIVLASVTARSDGTLQQLVHAIRGPVEVDGGEFIDVDVSVGAATEEAPTDLDALLAAADLRAYEHKRERRVPSRGAAPSDAARG